jgi:hypothetical protein
MHPPGGRLAVLLLASALAAPVLTGLSPEQERHEDAVPSGAPPGFEPVDVEEEVSEIRRREVRKMEEQVDADIHYRRVTAEQRIRARYGSATWNLYEPYE